MVLDMRDDRSEKVKYDYADYPIYIKKALLSTYSNFRAPIHWHDDMEFIYVVSGEMKSSSYNFLIIYLVMVL